MEYCSESLQNEFPYDVDRPILQQRAICRYGRGCTHTDPVHREKFWHPTAAAISEDQRRTHYICNECAYSTTSLRDLQRKTAWSNTSLVGCRISCLIDNKEWHEGHVLQYHKSGKHCVEFRAMGEKRWMVMSNATFYIIERPHSTSSEGASNEFKESSSYASDGDGLAPIEDKWVYVEDITLEYAFTQSVLFKVYGSVIQETGHKTKGHLSLTDDDKEIMKQCKGSLLYGELLPRGANKAFGSQRLSVQDASVLFDLGMGTGKVAMQAFLQFKNLKYVYGVELSAGRYRLAEEAVMRMVTLLGSDLFTVHVVSGQQIVVTEIISPPSSGDDSSGHCSSGSGKEPGQSLLRKVTLPDSAAAVMGLPPGSDIVGRMLHLECGDMFDVDSLSSADIVMLETDIPAPLHSNLTELLGGMREGARTLTYLDLRRVWQPHVMSFPFLQMEKNRGISDRFPTSWSFQRGHHFFLWSKITPRLPLMGSLSEAHTLNKSTAKLFISPQLEIEKEPDKKPLNTASLRKRDVAMEQENGFWAPRTFAPSGSSSGHVARYHTNHNYPVSQGNVVKSKCFPGPSIRSLLGLKPTSPKGADSSSCGSPGGSDSSARPSHPRFLYDKGVQGDRSISLHSRKPLSHLASPVSEMSSETPVSPRSISAQPSSVLMMTAAPRITSFSPADDRNERLSNWPFAAGTSKGSGLYVRNEHVPSQQQLQIEGSTRAVESGEEATCAISLGQSDGFTIPRHHPDRSLYTSSPSTRFPKEKMSSSISECINEDNDRSGFSTSTRGLEFGFDVLSASVNGSLSCSDRDTSSGKQNEQKKLHTQFQRGVYVESMTYGATGYQQHKSMTSMQSPPTLSGDRIVIADSNGSFQGAAIIPLSSHLPQTSPGASSSSSSHTLLHRVGVGSTAVGRSNTAPTPERPARCALDAGSQVKNFVRRIGELDDHTIVDGNQASIGNSSGLYSGCNIS